MPLQHNIKCKNRPVLPALNGSYIDCTLDSMPENDTTYSKDIVSSPAPTVKGMMYFLYPKFVLFIGR